MQNNYKYIKIAEKIVYLINSLSHLYTILVNPGIPSRKYYSNFYNDNRKRDYNLMECKKCNIIIPKELNVGHCYNCGVCVVGFDHHSYWMGKCIGKNNLISYNIFTFSLSVYLIMSILSLMLFIIFVHEENIKKQKIRNGL